MKWYRLLHKFFVVVAFLCLVGNVLAQDDRDPGQDIAVISLEAGTKDNYAYITHSGNVTERWLKPLGNNRTITYLAGNFDGVTGDKKDDIACLDFDENDDPYAFTESSFGVTPITSAWTKVLRTGSKKFYYFLSGDYDGDGNADIATFYRDYAGTDPESDVKAKITYGPTGVRQTADEDDWQFPQELNAGFVTGKFVGADGQNDAVKEIVAIRETEGKYEARIYSGPGGASSPEVWTIVTFTPAEQEEWKPVAFGAGDFNGDGWDDIVVVFYTEHDGTTGNPGYWGKVYTNPRGFQTSYGWDLGENVIYDSMLFNDYDKDGITDVAGVIDNHSGSRTPKIFFSGTTGETTRTETWTLNGDKPVTQYLTGDFGRFKATVSGSVYQEGGTAGLSGATVTMKIKSATDAYATVSSDENGNFSFSNIVNNDYDIVASKATYGFSPAVQAKTVSDADLSDVDFTSTNCPASYQISGHVMKYKKDGVPDTGLQWIDVTVTGTTSCSNSSYTVKTKTDSSGYYSVPVPVGSFVVKPTNGVYTLTPASRSVQISSASVGDVDFTGDACPSDNNKVDPGQCGCGFPDVNSDGDALADCLDLCPYDSAKTEPKVCGCGVSDVDTDGDGTPDCKDACETDPVKTAPGDCGCLRSENDSDGDKIKDCNDSCPYDAAKTDPGICGCGAADVNTDGDEAMDCVDSCPDDPKKVAPGLCGCGNEDVDENSNGICDTDANDRMYSISGRVVACVNDGSSSSSGSSSAICQGTGVIKGVGDITVHSAKGVAISRSLKKAQKCYPENKDPESLVGSYEIPDPCEFLNNGQDLDDWEPVSALYDGNHEDQRKYYESFKIRGAYTFWVRDAKQAEENPGYRVVRYFNLQANNKKPDYKFKNCKSRDTYQTDRSGSVKKNYNSNIPLLIDDAERSANGNEFCRFDPISLYRDMVEMDFLIVGCDPGWSAIANGSCVPSDPNVVTLQPPTNVEATKTSRDEITVSWSTSVGATDYHVYRSELTSLQSIIAKLISKGGKLNNASILSSVSFKSDEYLGSKYNVFDQGTVTFVDKTAVPGVRYVYSIKASNRFQRSDFSDLAEGYRRTGVDDEYDPDAPLSDCQVSSERDSDGDGISNAKEIEDGTNPCDRGSYFTKLTSPVYTKYNTFLGQANYLELTAIGTKSVKATIRIYNGSGKELGRRRITVASNSEVDVDVSGWVNSVVKKPNQFGLVRIDFDNRDPEVNLGGRMSVYRESLGQDYVNPADRSYSFAYTRELRNSAKGSSYLIANTIDPTNQGRTIQNWVEISNLEWGKRAFVVNYYDLGGALILSKRVTANRLGESDIQGGHEIDASTFLIEIIPVDGATRYLASLMRYGTTDSPVPGAEEFNFGMQMEAKSGIGDRHVVPISHLTGACWSQANQLEIANVKNQTVTATVKYFNRSGKQVASETIRLKPHQQIVKNSDALLDVNEIGMAEVSSTVVGSLVTQSTFFFHDCEENVLQSAYDVQSMIGGSEIQYGTYNRCLDMNNLLTVMNTGNSVTEVDINTQKSGSMKASAVKEYQLSKYMTILMDLSDSKKFTAAADTYGTLKMSSSARNKVGAMNLRIRQSEGRIDFAMPTVVR